MIVELRVENFKSIRKAEVRFGLFNTFIGKNGSGKTTIIYAIDFLASLARGEVIDSIIRRIAPYDDLMNINGHSKKMLLSAIIQVDRGCAYRYSVEIGRKEAKTIESFLDSGYYFLSEKLDKLGVEKEEYATIFSRDYDDGKTIIRDGDGVELSQHIGITTPALCSLSIREAQEVSALMAKYSVLYADYAYRGSDGIQFSDNLKTEYVDGIATALYIKDKTLFGEAMAVIREIIPSFENPRVVSIPLDELSTTSNGAERFGYLIAWKDIKNIGSKGFSSNALSSGNLRTIYLILKLYLAESKTSFIVEEIENGMHLGRISLLIDKIKMIGKNKKIQIFLSTHNYDVLNDVLPKEVIVVRNKNGSDSNYEILSDTSEYSDIKDELEREPTSKEIVDSGLLF